MTMKSHLLLLAMLAVPFAAAADGPDGAQGLVPRAGQPVAGVDAVAAVEQLPEPPPALIRVELLIVRLPTDRALELQPELRDPARVAAAQDKLLALIQKKQAQLVDWPVLTTKSGNRAVLENIHEERYPIEYQPPKVVAAPPESPDPQHVDKPEAPAAEKPAPKKENAAGPQPAPPPVVKLADRMIAGVPSTFETRNVGVTLEIEPNVAPDGQNIDAQLAPQHITLLGFRRHKLEVEGKYTVVTETPEFQTEKVSTSITLPSGQPHLLSFHQLQQPADTVELFILKMTLLPMGKAR
jgi:hypothetical protein